MAGKLSDNEISKRLSTIPGWIVQNHKLHRDFKFADFKSAFRLMAKVADVAEEMNHHPEWFNVYNRLSIDLTTHDAGGISEKDFALAQRINEFFGS